MRQNVNASIGYSGKKRAAVSRPQDRKDAGPRSIQHRTSCPSACENPRAPVVPDGTWVGGLQLYWGSPPRPVLQRKFHYLQCWYFAIDRNGSS